jgi:hypothetical protein
MEASGRGLGSRCSLTVPVGVGGTWLCGAVKFRECCNLGAQEKGDEDNRWERGGGQLKRFPLLGIGCFYRCPPIVRASLPGLLVDLVAWVPLVNQDHLRHTSSWLPRRRSQQCDPAATLLQTVESWMATQGGLLVTQSRHLHHCGRGPVVCK